MKKFIIKLLFPAAAIFFISMIGAGGVSAGSGEGESGGSWSSTSGGGPNNGTVSTNSQVIVHQVTNGKGEKCLVCDLEPDPKCGNSLWEAGEQCEGLLGTTPNFNTCVNCQLVMIPQTCGNLTVDPGEACDDGNRIDTDSCTNACQDARCGDTYVQSGIEACDDGNTSPGDGCSATCQVDYVCGNGVVESGEDCDNGPDNGQPGNPCSSSCAVTYVCGNGVPENGEACDDGNVDPGDGCSPTCQKECGNGTLDAGAGEQCDDGNTADGDACSSTCLKEAGTITCTPSGGASFSFPCEVNPQSSNGGSILWTTAKNSGDCDNIVGAGSGFDNTVTGSFTAGAASACVITVSVDSQIYSNRPSADVTVPQPLPCTTYSGCGTDADRFPNCSNELTYKCGADNLAWVDDGSGTCSCAAASCVTEAC